MVRPLGIISWQESLFHDSSGDFPGAGCSVGLISIDVHCESILLGYADDGVAEDKFASGRLFHLNVDNLTVLHPESGSICRSHMHVTLGDDNTLAEFNLSARTHDLARCRTCDVCTFAYRSHDAESAGISERELNLVLRTDRSENGALQAALGTYDLNFLI